MDLRLICRIARPSDYQNIVRLCRRAAGSDDYVIPRLPETIRKRGVFIAYSREGVIVGMSNFTPVFDKSGWVGMWRTDPDWRGKGVSPFIQRQIAKYAKKKRFRALRCFILSTNTPSLRAATKGGFKVVAHGTHLTSTTSSKRSSNLFETRSDVEPFTRGLRRSFPSDQILHSRYVRKMNGYLRYGYAFVRANEANLSCFSKQGELFHFADSWFILKRTEKDYAEFSILSGKLRETLSKILSTARHRGIRTIGGFVPYDHNVVSVCQNLGFKVDSWAKHGMIFEKKI